MGEHYLLANLSRREFIRHLNPAEPENRRWQYFQWAGSAAAGAALFELLTSGEGSSGRLWGQWAGDCIVLLGGDRNPELYRAVEKEFTDITGEALAGQQGR